MQRVAPSNSTISRQNKRPHVWLLAVFMATMALVALFVFARTCLPINDDKFILRSFMGFQPMGPANFHAYVQPLISWPLYWLSIGFPAIHWFSIVQIALIWLSNIVIFRSILILFIQRSHPLWHGILACLLFWFLYCMFSQTRITYTVTASFLGSAAALHLLSIEVAALDDRRYIRSTILSMVLLALAYSLRLASGLASACYVALILLYHSIAYFGFGRHKKRSLRPLVKVMLLFAGVLLLLWAGRTFEIHVQDQSEYIRWQNARTQVLDYLQLNEIPDEMYAEVGWSRNDASLLNVWYTMDEKYSTSNFEALQKLADTSAYRPSPGAALYQLYARSAPTYYSAIILAIVSGCCLLWVLLCRDARQFKLSLLLLAATGMLCMAQFAYLLLGGRTPYQAALAVIIPAAAIVFGLLPAFFPRKLSLSTFKGWTVVTSCLLIVAISYGSQYNNIQSMLHQTTTWDYSTHADMDQQALAHPDQLFIYDTRLVNDIRLFPDVSDGIPTNLMFWGGWDRSSPEYLSRLAAFGIDGNHFTARDWLNPAMRFLSLDETPNEMLLHYLQQDIDASVTYERERLSIGLYSYRFYLPQ